MDGHEVLGFGKEKSYELLDEACPVLFHHMFV